MPTTFVDWNLRCIDRKRIDRLINDLEHMAILHKSIIEANWIRWATLTDLTTVLYPELKNFEGIAYKHKKGGYSPEIKEVIKNQYYEFITLVSNIKDREKLLDRVIIKYDKQLEGNILIERELFGSDSIHSKPKENNYESDAEKKQMIEQIHADFVKTSKVSLYGIQFRLYESRWPMEGYDLLSFVFAEFPEYPELDGLCVEVNDRVANCSIYQDPIRNSADIIISNPSILLRYLNEDVVFKLLTWVNFFHFPEMRFEFGWQSNHKVKQEEIANFFGNSLLKNKALIELLEYSYQEHRYYIDEDLISNVPLIDELLNKVVSTEKLEKQKRIAEVLFGKTEKIKATFHNKIIYSDLYKIANEPMVAAPFFCEGCGLHLGLNLERSIAAVKYLQNLTMSELKVSGFYFDLDLSKFVNAEYKSEDDFKNIYFHAGSCSFCDSEEKWMEMRPLLDDEN